MKKKYFTIEPEQMEQTMESIFNALDKLVISGRNNVAIVAGSMKMLEDMITSYREDEEVPIEKAIKDGSIIQKEGG